MSGGRCVRVKVSAPANAHIAIDDLRRIFGKHHAMDDETVLFSDIARLQPKRVGALAAQLRAAISVELEGPGRRVTLADGRIFEATEAGIWQRVQ